MIVARGYKELQWVNRVLEGVTRGFRGFNALLGVTGVTRGYPRLQGVTGAYKGSSGGL